MFKIFQVNHNHEDAPSALEVKIEDGDVVEAEVGQIALDILENAEKITIIAPIAGVDTSEIDISISRNILTISGDRKHPKVYDSADRVLVKECFFGPFSRSVILPENLAFNKVHATMENNLLSVDIPKLTFPEKTIKIDKLES